jgi:uncharacterized membrane protein (UPF0127 family)
MKKIALPGLALLVIVLGFFFFRKDNSISGDPVSTNSVTSGSNPALQGTLTFLSVENGKTIDIEVARSDYEHAKGLMDRTTLPHNQGMLFVFDDMQPRSFWMRNTRISLDIIYVDDQKRVVSIQKNTIPMSEESLPSTGPAQYVVEVNAGFTDLYDIKPGDSLSFQIP